jgi:hypothetical protein
MALTLTQSCERKAYLREGAIYSDSSNNIIRLLSIHADYCVYVYVALENQKSEMQGSVTGLTRRKLFEAGFIFIAECVEEWNGCQRKSSARRFQTLHIPSSPGSIDVALVSEPQRRRS